MSDVGFNNFEQGILVACAVAATLMFMFLTIVVSSAALRAIGMEHHLQQIAEAREPKLASFNRPPGAVDVKDTTDLRRMVDRAISLGIGFSVGGEPGSPLWFWDEGMTDGK